MTALPTLVPAPLCQFAAGDLTFLLGSGEPSDPFTTKNGLGDVAEISRLRRHWEGDQNPVPGINGTDAEYIWRSGLTGINLSAVAMQLGEYQEALNAVQGAKTVFVDLYSERYGPGPVKKEVGLLGIGAAMYNGAAIFVRLAAGAKRADAGSFEVSASEFREEGLRAVRASHLREARLEFVEQALEGLRISA